MYAWRDGSYTREQGGQINVLSGFKIFLFCLLFSFFKSAASSILGNEMIREVCISLC